MLTRETIETRFGRAVTRAGKAAQLLARRKATSASDRAWAIAFVATLADSRGKAPEELSGITGPEPTWEAARAQAANEFQDQSDSTGASPCR